MNTKRTTCFFPKFLPQRDVTLPLVVTISLLTGGCNEVAGLKDHKLFAGFPDSRSEVLCAPIGPGLVDRISCDATLTPTGQDGHLQSSRPEYLDEGRDLRDSITNLVWRKRADVVDNYDAAVAYCESLVGYRLPSRIELISLLDYGGSDILIDPAFQGMQNIRYRTSTVYSPGDPEFDKTHWGVNFDGQKPPFIIDGTTLLPGETHQLHDTNKAGVLCVRDDAKPLITGPFEPAGVNNKFLRDTRTGLMWKPTPIAKVNWEEALQECSKLPDAGYDDFRLPNAKEIATIIDDTTDYTATVRTHAAFQFKNEMTLWSSTPTPDARFAYALRTGGASIGREGTKLDYYGALCVRGPD